jgi:hypothetical protein
MEKLLNKIWKFFYHPFTHNPEDFKIRVVESWFSIKYIHFQYTANGGRSWKYIYHCCPPLFSGLEYNYTWERITFPLGNGNFSYEKEKLSSYQKILDYESEQEKKFYDGIERRKIERKEYEIKMQEAFKKANE